MRYLSFFSGIGGFEVAIHQLFPNAECIGYSEIKSTAISVYQRHYPDHVNLGDITAISSDKILSIIEDGCDLVVAGFPCTNLSSMSSLRGQATGLKGAKSGLFYDLIRILSIIIGKIPSIDLIIENNASMSRVNKKLVTEEIQRIMPKNRSVYVNVVDNSDISVQVRKRIFWTTFPVEQPTECIHTWSDILEPIADIGPEYFVSEKYIQGMNTIINSKNAAPYFVLMESDGKHQRFITTENTKRAGRTRYQLSMHSDTGSIKDNVPYSYPHGKSRPLCAGGGGGFSKGMLVDRRYGGSDLFKFRYFTIKEKERLFGFSDGYTQGLSNTAATDVLGNAVSVLTARHILEYLPV